MIERFYGGPFHGRLVVEFLKFRTQESYDICEFSESFIEPYAAPTQMVKKPEESIKARYVKFPIRQGMKSRWLWVYDPAECETVSELGRYKMTPDFHAFLVSCFQEE